MTITMSNLYFTFTAALMGVVLNIISDAELVFIFSEWITWVPSHIYLRLSHLCVARNKVKKEEVLLTFKHKIYRCQYFGSNKNNKFENIASQNNVGTRSAVLFA